MAFDFKNYLQEKISSLTDLKVNVVDEMDFKLDSDIKIIIKSLTGTLYQNSIILPIQLYVISSKLEETKLLMQTFTETFSQTKDRYSFKNFKQVYTTPVVLENFMPIQNKQMNVIYINATLTILEDVNDIKKITINNEIIDCINVQEHYIVQATSKKIADQELSFNKKQTATYSLTLTLKNNSSAFCRKLKLIRHGYESGNAIFPISIYYDEDDEPMIHNMVILDHVLVTSENGLPINTVVFGVDE